MRALWTNHYTTLPWEHIFSESLCPKLYGVGWVSCYSWAKENGTGGVINELKHFLTADTIPCRSSSNMDKPGTEEDTVATESWFDWFLVSSSTSPVESITFCLSVCIRALPETFKPSSWYFLSSHCGKMSKYGGFFGPFFLYSHCIFSLNINSVFSPNTYKKIRIRKNSVFGHFLRSEYFIICHGGQDSTRLKSETDLGLLQYLRWSFLW